MTVNVVLFFRDSFDSRIISNYLHAEGINISTIVIEKGAKAKRRKLKRIFKSDNKSLVARVLSIIFLLIYSEYYYFRMKKIIRKTKIKVVGVNEYPNIKRVDVDDINELAADSIDFSVSNVDLILVYGTSILLPVTLNKLSNVPLLNIHTGVLPTYRNVHSDFWAMYNSDWDNVGVTLFHVNEGIDTGNIIELLKNSEAKNQSLSEIKAKNLELSCELGLRACRFNGQRQGVVQHKESGVFFPSPDYKDYWTLIKRVGLKKLK